MKYQLVIFDLDGTVLDTLGDLAGAVNHALEAHEMPGHTIEEIRTYIGNGVEKLIRRAVPSDTPEAAIMSVLKEFRAYYSAHTNDVTRPYPGILDLMRSLRDAGMKIGIQSNKYDAALQELCRIHFNGLYDDAMGEGERSPRKPDPTGAKTLLKEFNVAPEHAVYIGDSEVDLATARNAGIDCAWVSWGFRRAEEITTLAGVPRFDTVEELKKYLIG